MDRIDEIGYRAWDEFYIQMRRWYRHDRGRGIYWSHKFIKAFKEIAAHCISNNIDVTDYIIRSFEIVNVDHKYLTPRDFVTKIAFKNYEEHRYKFKEELLTAWKTQIETLVDLECKFVPDKYDNEMELLICAIMPFEAWFRVLYIEPFNEEIFKYYGALAHKQLNENRKLLTLMRKYRADNVIQLEHRSGIFIDTAIGGNA